MQQTANQLQAKKHLVFPARGRSHLSIAGQPSAVYLFFTPGQACVFEMTDYHN